MNGVKRMKQIWDLVVVGAGASGLMAAAAALEYTPGLRVLVLEKEKKPGKRLLATGNGRCNLSNRRISPQRYHGDADKIFPVLERFSVKAIEKRFASWGLPCREDDEGRIYPYNLQASAVQELLLHRIQRAGGEIRCCFSVLSCQKAGSEFCLQGEMQGAEEKIDARRVIFACGGLSYPSLGGSERSWGILGKMGHDIAKGFPALVSLKTEKKLAAPLKGARCKGRVTLRLENGKEASSQGEIQFTETGLSGICVFEISRLYGDGKSKAQLICDLMPEYTFGDLLHLLRIRGKDSSLPAGSLLDSILQKQVGREILRRCFGKGMGEKDGFPGEFTEKQLAAIAREIKNFSFPVLGTGGWDAAQVTAGGVRLKQINLETMESKICKGLYLAGEVLNIDGDCGGFNLHWAWSTGCLAGISAARSLKSPSALKTKKN